MDELTRWPAKAGAVLCALLTLCGPASVRAADAASPHRITMAAVIRLQASDLAHLSVDGQAVVADTAAGLDARRLVRLGPGGAETLGDGSMPAVSPDRRWMVFARGRDWVLRDQATGAVRTLDAGVSLPGYGDAPVWSPDSRYVAIHYDHQALDAPAVEAPAAVAGVRTLVRDPTQSRPSPIHTDARLLIWDIVTGHTDLRAVPATATFGGSWGRDPADPTYYYAISQHAAGGATPFTSIRALHVRTGAEDDLYRLPSFQQTVHPRLSPDGRRLAFAADLDTPVYAVSASVVTLDLATRRATRLTGDGLSAGELAWGADGRIYVLVRAGGLRQLWAIGLDGRQTQLTHDVVSRHGLVAAADGRAVVYVVTTGAGRTELRTWSMARRAETGAILIADPGGALTLGRFEPMTWAAADGLRLHGFLFFPPDFDARRRYPLLVNVHGGGPGTALNFTGLFNWRAQTPLEWHAWAALGYIVFLPDYRSSGEYGAAVNRARMAAASGDQSGIVADAEDVAAGVAAVVQRDYVDPCRVVAIGHSAGGPRLDYLLTRTHRFQAAVLDDPAPFGPEAEDLALAKRGAPAPWGPKPPGESADFLFDGQRVATPTLVLVGDEAHGALDPISAELQYAMLLAAKTPTRFVRFLDDGHVPLSVASAEAHYREMAGWFARYAPAGAPAQSGAQCRTQASVASAR